MFQRRAANQKEMKTHELSRHIQETNDDNPFTDTSISDIINISDKLEHIFQKLATQHQHADIVRGLMSVLGFNNLQNMQNIEYNRSGMKEINRLVNLMNNRKIELYSSLDKNKVPDAVWNYLNT